MAHTIEAIYQKGVFKPLSQVDLPEGTRVRVEAETTSLDTDREIYQQILAEGATPAEAAKIMDNFRLL